MRLEISEILRRIDPRESVLKVQTSPGEGGKGGEGCSTPDKVCWFFPASPG